MSRRNRRRSARGDSKVTKGLAMLVIAALLAGIGFLFYLNVTTKVIKLDQNTMCRIGEPASNVYAVLIDSTEALPRKSAAQAVIKVKNLLSNAPVNSKITLYAIQNGNENHVLPVGEICKPDSADGASELTSNPRYIQEQFDKGFLKPLEKHLDKLVHSGPSNTSPIIESLQSTVIESFENTSSTGSKQIVVISDMIQNSNLYSFYRQRPNYDQYKKLSRESGQGIINLNGIRVDLYIVPRQTPKGSRQDLIKFWSEFLQDNGAAMGSSLEPLS